MKIVLCGSFWPGSLETSYSTAFKSLGVEVMRFDWDALCAKSYLARNRFTEKLFRLKMHDGVGNLLTSVIQKESPDLLFVMKGKYIAPETLTTCKRLMGERPIVNFNPDSPWEPRNSSARLLEGIAEYDAHFTWNLRLLPKFLEAGAKAVHYLPFAYDPKLHYPVDAITNIVWDAVFIGTFDEHRDKLLSKLGGCKIGIWGNGWERARHVPRDWVQSKAVYGEEATTLQSSALCSLNVLRPQNTGSHNMRTFEIPATRNLMLTTRSEEQATFFAEGKEMMCYSDPTELFAIIQELRADPERASSIAHQGYERVRDETYTKRALQMLATLGFPSFA